MTMSNREHLRSRARPWGMAVILWAFGLCTSILLVGLWGRSVANDPQTLEDATQAVLRSGLVHERVEEWLTTGIVEAEDRAPGEVRIALEEATGSPEFRGAVDRLVDQAVAAALAPPDSAAAVDLSNTLDTAIPPIVASLADHGLVADEEALRIAALETSDLVLWSGDRGVVARTAERTGGILTTVVLVMLAALVVTGGAAVALSEDRIAQLRSLAIRVAVSAFTFAIFLRVGAWAVDPRGGRSPVASGAATLLGSSLHVPLLVGLLAAAVGVLTLLRKHRRNHRPAEDAETGAAVPAGRAGAP